MILLRYLPLAGMLGLLAFAFDHMMCVDARMLCANDATAYAECSK